MYRKKILRGCFSIAVIILMILAKFGIVFNEVESGALVVAFTTVFNWLVPASLFQKKA